MNKLITLIAVLFSLVVNSQDKPTSFYFGEPQPKNVISKQKFDPSICGTYVLESDSSTQLVVKEKGIYLQQNVLFALTKRDIRKSKGKYYTNEGLLHGIVSGQGIPFIKQRDTTFAIYKQVNDYFNPTTKNVLRKQNQTYFLNEKLQNNQFRTSLLHTTNKGIAIYSMDHEKVMDEILKFSKVDTLDLYSFKTFVALPTLPEINSFIQHRGFTDVVHFIKPEYYIERDI